MPTDTNLTTSSELLRQVRDPNNRRAWQTFFQRYGPFIHGYCRALRLPPDDADEVTQEVLICLARKMNGFVYDPGRTFRGWLRAIIRLQVRKFRSNLVRRWLDRGTGDNRVWDQLEHTPDPDTLLDPLLDEVTAETRRLRERTELIQARVQAAVKPLTWQAFWLTLIEGRSPSEVAECLDMSYCAVCMASQRVRKKLRQEGMRNL